jgi:hypothetical protein
MTLYIWLLWHQIVIECNQVGCVQSSMAHFNYFVGLGVLELLLEIGGIVKIYRKINKASESEGPEMLIKYKDED